MKNVITCSRIYRLAIIAFAFLPFTAMAQNKKEDKKAEIKNIVEARNFVFKAQTALPSSGNARQLTYDFDLTVSKDTIISDLPYFGRAYTAPLNPSVGPLNFTSTDFHYKVTDRKKGGWVINITPKDQQDPKQFTLNIFDNGSASVVVTSYNRQPISFNGYVTAKK
ncbi:hypothetical protein A3860_27025 [Niastella vici]|uniref:DUF4251 domain-containing protein n=1 Tax=Niastella vici TaxID=1703345 RepID=A0A1V9FWG1_9BACT|nr:DUF4251 domain-containing protein [Niastella vici]OQP62667.1 hypothetical protein A3860_27025 [Niastella vici]